LALGLGANLKAMKVKKIKAKSINLISDGEKLPWMISKILELKL